MVEKLFFATFFCLVGIAMHVMGKVSSIKKKFPEKSIKEVFNTFLQEDWNTLICSGIMLIAFVAIVYVSDKSNDPAKDDFLKMLFPNIVGVWLIRIIVAFCAGYFGQKVFYKFMGTTEKRFNAEMDKE